MVDQLKRWRTRYYVRGDAAEAWRVSACACVRAYSSAYCDASLATAVHTATVAETAVVSAPFHLHIVMQLIHVCLSAC